MLIGGDQLRQHLFHFLSDQPVTALFAEVIFRIFVRFPIESHWLQLDRLFQHRREGLDVGLEPLIGRAGAGDYRARTVLDAAVDTDTATDLQKISGRTGPYANEAAKLEAHLLKRPGHKQDIRPACDRPGCASTRQYALPPARIAGMRGVRARVCGKEIDGIRYRRTDFADDPAGAPSAETVDVQRPLRVCRTDADLRAAISIQI